MAQFDYSQEYGSSQGAPRQVYDPPHTYTEFQPLGTSERKKPQSSSRRQEPTSVSTSDEVSTLLYDMTDVVTFSKHRFVKPKLMMLTSLMDNMEYNKSVIEDAVKRFDSLDLFITVASENILSYVDEWDKRLTYYKDALELSRDPRNPSPNLSLLPSSDTISQQAYGDLLTRMVQLCSKVGRELRLADLKLSNMNELSVTTKRKIQLLLLKAATNSGNVDRLYDQEYVKLYCFLEQVDHDVKLIKEKWQMDGGQPNPETPRLFRARSAPRDDNWVPPKCNNAQIDIIDMLKMGSDPAYAQEEGPHSSQGPNRHYLSGRSQDIVDEHNDEQYGAVSSGRCLRAQARTNGGRSQAVEDIVQRYNGLQHTVRDEMKNINYQQQLMTKSQAALKKRSSNKCSD